MHSGCHMTQAVRSLTEAFIADAYPAEVPFVDVVFERLEEEFTTSADQGSGFGALFLKRFSLPFDRERKLQLVSPIVMLTLQEVLNEARSYGWNPTLEQIQSGIRALGGELGGDAKLIEQLADRVAPRVVEMFEDGTLTPSMEGSAPEALHDSGDLKPDRAFVTQHFNGETESAQPCHLGDLPSLESAVKRYDIIIDEVRDQGAYFRRGDDHDRQFAPAMPRAQKGTIWLILTQMENGQRWISKSQIEGLFSGLDSMTENASYHYPKAFRDLFDDSMRFKILQKGAGHSYPIAKSGWAFLWIRRLANPAFSLLVDGLNAEDCLRPKAGRTSG